MILDAFVVGVTLHPLTVKQLNTKVIHFPGVNSLYSGSCSPKLEIRISFLNLDVITHIPCKKGCIYINVHFTYDVAKKINGGNIMQNMPIHNHEM